MVARRFSVITTVLLNNNKTLSVTQTDRIYELENKADKLRFLVPAPYAEYTVKLFSINQDGVEASVDLTADEEPYEGFTQYFYELTSVDTYKEGNITYWLEFYGADALVTKSGTAKIKITNHESADEDTEEEVDG